MRVAVILQRGGWVSGIAVVLCMQAHSAVWYVDAANQSGTESGTRWGEAFSTIQPAIDAASADGGGEVWVAKGTYAEQRHYLQDEVDTGSLKLAPMVDLYGGFAGNEKRRDQRDWKVNLTTISGHTSRDGKAAFHVVFGADNARIDGFHIQGGYAEWPKASTLRAGGGVICQQVRMAIVNCTISGNGTRGGSAGAGGAGGGVYCRESDVSIQNCRIAENTSLLSGGGLSFIECPRSEVVDTVIEGNRATEGRGGGVQCYRSSPTFTRCTIQGNEGHFGGGVSIYTTSNPTFNECTIIENRGVAGGAIRTAHHCNPTFIACTVADNQVTSGGGGGLSIWRGCSARIVESTFTRNRADRGGAFNVMDAVLIVQDSQVRQNHGSEGGGLWCGDKADALLERSMFEGNDSCAITLTKPSAKLTVTATRFKSNAGGVLRDVPRDATFKNVREIDTAMAAWTGNAQDDDPLPSAVELAAGGDEDWAEAMAEADEAAVAVVTPESAVFVKGNMIVMAIVALGAIVVLVGALIYFAGRMGTNHSDAVSRTRR